MDDEPKDEESWKAWAAAQEDGWKQKVAEQEDFWKRQAAAQEEETIRQHNLMYGGLIGVGIVMVQPFLTAGADVFDLSAKICVIAFSIAVPLLAALLMVNRHETYRRRRATSILVLGAQSVAFGTGFVGVVAGFWHILPAAGVAVLVCGLVAIFIHSSGYTRLELEHAKAAQNEEEAQE